MREFEICGGDRKEVGNGSGVDSFGEEYGGGAEEFCLTVGIWGTGKLNGNPLKRIL